MMPEYKYNEDKYLNDIKKYLDGTYGEHYVAKDIQVVDIWESLGSLESTARDTAIKYLCRYGKKDGKNRKDLLKAIHYIILMMYAGEEEQQAEKLKAVFQQRPLGPLDPQMQDIRDAYERVDYHDSHIRN
jgi:hypothetical protein